MRLPLTLAFVLATAPVFAQDAETLFREGRKALESGDYATACSKFAESQRLEPAPGTLLNLAGCEERAGKLMASAEHYRLAAAGFPQKDSRRGVAIEKAAALDKRFGRLVLHRKGLPEGARVRDGDAVVSTFETPIVVDPGTHSLVVEVEGRLPKTFDTAVGEGATVEIDLSPGAPKGEAREPGPGPVAPLGPTPKPKGAGSPLRTVGFITGGVGAASLVAGSVIGVVALGRSATYRSHCDAQNLCDPDGFDAASDLRWMSPVSTVLVIGGAVLLAGGLVLWLTAPKAAASTGLVPAPVVRF
jgi:hypothetical protein